MEYVDFGRTGLKVSVAGLGCGGNSKLDLAHNLFLSSRVGYFDAQAFIHGSAVQRQHARAERVHKSVSRLVRKTAEQVGQEPPWHKVDA